MTKVACIDGEDPELLVELRHGADWYDFDHLLAPHRLRRPAGHETVDLAEAVIASEAKQSRGDGAHPWSGLLPRLRLLAMTALSGYFLLR